ncbi:MAG: winged helix-turn-helix domain-containing protein, partial [Chloroflexota bacterium]|nr:winged helix-turn-helix domain-containing protein [Chloroflexota bacterium]
PPPLPLVLGPLVIDVAQHAITKHGMPLQLTPREFALLVTLASHPGRVFTRNQLLERIWGDAVYDDHVVDVHMNNLRKKLEDDSAHPRYIDTVRGVGYRFHAVGA